MNIPRWLARREQSWRQLDTLLKKIEKQGLKALRAEEIQTLASLYRSASADLARARTQQAGQMITQKLQTLVSRAYAQIYQGSRRQEWAAVRQFYLWGFPAAVQRSRGYLVLAVLLFLGAALVSAWVASRNPSFFALAGVPDAIVSQVRDRQELWTGSILGVEPFASSYIMVNNIRVAFEAVAGGITFGLRTVYILLLNGLLIGAIGTLVGQNNLAVPFWAFVFPHGSLELPAIFLAAAAGFLIARALLFPGSYRRIDALKLYGQQAAQLVFGIVPLLVIAGVIEGFFSPNPLVPALIKYGVGIGLLIVLISYLGRKPSTF
jgi:uncharacterized membrane protein SpoIIM required for sporulation